MAKRLDMLPLEELYDRPKITPAVMKHILMKEDFSKIVPHYCAKACTLPGNCQKPGNASVGRGQVDILVVYPTMATEEKWRKGHQVDDQHKRIVRAIAVEFWDGLSWDFTYALRCRPEDPKTKITTVRRCVPYLEEEIRQRRPKVVIGMGVDVGKALRLARCPRGYVQHMVAGGFEYPLICSIHPKTLMMIRQNASGSFWGPDYLDVLRRDFDKARMIAKGEVALKPVQQAVDELRATRLFVATDIGTVKKFEEYLLEEAAKHHKKEVIVSWDTETTGLDPWAEDARFLCHQFGFRDKDGGVSSLVIPLWHRDNKYYNPRDAWEYVERILSNNSIIKVPHNGAFDLVYTKVVMGLDVARVDFDTMLLIHSMNSGMQGQYDLKTTTSDLLFETQLGGYEDLMQFEDEEAVEEEELEEEST